MESSPGSWEPWQLGALAGRTGPARLDGPWEAGLALAGWTGPGRVDWPWQAGLALASGTGPGWLDWPWLAGLALADWAGPGRSRSTSHSSDSDVRFDHVRRRLIPAFDSMEFRRQ